MSPKSTGPDTDTARLDPASALARCWVGAWLAVALTLAAILAGTPRTTMAQTTSVVDIYFYGHQNGSTPESQLTRTIPLAAQAGQSVLWYAYPTASWIQMSPQFGVATSTPTDFEFSVDPTALGPGMHTGYIALIDLVGRRVLGVLALRLRVCSGHCLFVDAAATSHVISPLLFGSQIDYLDGGGGLWDTLPQPVCDANQAGGAPREPHISELEQAGVRMLRYPGGIPSDFFDWAGAVGPVESRTPQIVPWALSEAEIEFECPLFGPDEFADLAVRLEAPMLITTAAKNATPSEVAGWLQHYRARGIPAGYWEIGNEIYIPGAPKGDPSGTPYWTAATYMSSSEYAQAFDAQAAALRAVDPTVKIGLVASPYAIIDGEPWNANVASASAQRADFISVHLYQPARDVTSTCAPASAEQIYGALLSAQELVKLQIQTLKDTMQQSGNAQSKTPDIAVTEHGTIFVPCEDPFNPFDPLWRENRTLGSALFSALSYNVFMRDPRVTIANHVALLHPRAQALLNTDPTDGVSSPVRSAFFHVLKLYSESAQGTRVSAALLDPPLHSTQGYEVIPAYEDLPVLDTVAVRSADDQRLHVYVVNRSLTEGVTTRIALDRFVSAPSAVTAAVLHGAAVDAVNTAAAPDAVSVSTVPLSPSNEIEYTFPAHSLVRLTFAR
ncbi:MAG: hypothetical protein H6983_02180 [Ectothiorhodospiraceae bacterium]|nr:hypothetical protein [Ectothiorhodospiraceae bacterium]